MLSFLDIFFEHSLNEIFQTSQDVDLDLTKWPLSFLILGGLELIWGPHRHGIGHILKVMLIMSCNLIETYTLYDCCVIRHIMIVVTLTCTERRNVLDRRWRLNPRWPLVSVRLFLRDIGVFLETFTRDRSNLAWRKPPLNLTPVLITFTNMPESLRGDIPLTPPPPTPGSCHHLSPFPPSHYKDVVRNTRLLPWTYVYNIGQWLLHVLGSVIQSAIVVHGWMEYRERVEMAAISCGTSHASAVSTPLRWIFKNALEKTSHSCRITCGRSESARERRTALYKSD